MTTTEAPERAVRPERAVHVPRWRVALGYLHAAGVPLLIFPEGTCVNNEYCVMFKRGAFDLGATVCPVAIKYNKIFVDAFWNSKRQSFTAHLVCSASFLPPGHQSCCIGDAMVLRYNS